MFERCANLQDCEGKLTNTISQVQLLCEIPLSDSDLSFLAQEIGTLIKNDSPGGTRQLRNNYPICFACFLSAMGRFYEKDLGYWPIIEEKVGLSDTNWQVRWGQFFVKFLEKYNFEKFDQESGLAYLTPILGHAGIPDSCLDEYFARILHPIVKRELLDPYDQEEIIHYLDQKRKINAQQVLIDNRKKELEGELLDIQKKITQISSLEHVIQRIEDFVQKEANLQPALLAIVGLENAQKLREQLHDRIQLTSKDLSELLEKEKHLQANISTLRRDAQAIIEKTEQIENLFSEHRMLSEQLQHVENNKTVLDQKIEYIWSQISEKPWTLDLVKPVINISFLELENLAKDYVGKQFKLASIKEQINEQEIKVAAARLQPTRVSLDGFFLVHWFRRIFAWIKKIGEPTDFQEGEQNLSGSTSSAPGQSANNQKEILENLQEQKLDIEKNLDGERKRIVTLLNGTPIQEKLLFDNPLEILDVMKDIQATLSDARQADGIVINIQTELHNLIEHILHACVDLGLEPENDIVSLQSAVRDAVIDAQRMQSEATASEEELNSKIFPDIQKHEESIRQTQVELTVLDNRLERLPGGSVEAGLDYVNSALEHRAELAFTRDKLSKKLISFDTLEGLLRKGLQNDVYKKISSVKVTSIKDREKITAQIDLLNNEANNFSLQYAGIDEPIRRFLLYGGEIADGFLVNTVAALANLLNGETIEKIIFVLSQRVIPKLQSWYEHYEAELVIQEESGDEINKETGEEFRFPKLIIETTTREIIAHFPSQIFSQPGRTNIATLRVLSDQKVLGEFSLLSYKFPRKLIKTQDIEIPLPEPSSTYQFQLFAGNQEIRTWDLQCLDQEHPLLAFDLKTKKFIQREYLPKTQLLLVVRNNAIIQPESCILVDGIPLFAGWREFVWYEVDLQKTDQLFLEQEGILHQIPLSTNDDSAISLIGGEICPNITSNDCPVYCHPPEKLSVPLPNLNEIHLYRFSILTNKAKGHRASKHFSLGDSELATCSTTSQDKFDLFLQKDKLLGKNPISTITLRIFKSPYLDWRVTFVVIPGIQISYNQPIYPPYRNNPGMITAHIKDIRSNYLTVHEPAIQIHDQDHACKVQVPASENFVIGSVRIPDEQGIPVELPFSLELPKVFWRFQGMPNSELEQWSDMFTDELWIGDWQNTEELFLLLKFPSEFEGLVALKQISNDVAGEYHKIQDGKVRFDLKAIEDGLRSGELKETIGVKIIAPDYDIPDIPLFSVITRWQASEIKCFQTPIDDNIKLDIRWKERGKAESKTIHLWYLTKKPIKLTRSLTITGDQEKAELTLKAKDLNPGTYLIHLEPSGPWAPIPICPQLDAPNTVIVEIAPPSRETSIEIRSVCVDAKHSYPLPNGGYKIQILGKVSNRKLPSDLDIDDLEQILVTPLNEDWYVGILDISSHPRVADRLSDTNPVKFEYDPNRKIVTSIEDRHGEGAMYCYQCKMLFWSQTTLENEKSRGHRNYGPIEEFHFKWLNE